jgi:hypothetical protein
MEESDRWALKTKMMVLSSCCGRTSFRCRPGASFKRLVYMQKCRAHNRIPTYPRFRTHARVRTYTRNTVVRGSGGLRPDHTLHLHGGSGVQVKPCPIDSKPATALLIQINGQVQHLCFALGGRKDGRRRAAKRNFQVQPFC